MKFLKIGTLFALPLVFGAIAVAQSSRSVQSGQSTLPMQSPSGWGRWQMGSLRPSLVKWSSVSKWHGPGPIPRHDAAMKLGIPASYSLMTNPLPKTQETLIRGAAVYVQKCASCHGTKGLGDGEAGHNLSPAPGNLAWLADMPMRQWDGFKYWTIAEGGAQFRSAMPAFKDTLSQDDIWAATTYIQAHLPRNRK